ncbi:MAG: HEPN domain-containing protein [Candidatus Korarchaeota archaeon]|nr:HEPN domain-containing protein [Candidatus Korarchaeota archaeon]
MGEGGGPLEGGEALAYLETARDQLEDARLAINAGRYALCVLLSSMSAENASSALIIAVGAKPSRRHRNSLVLHRLSGLVEGELRELLAEVIHLLKRLEPHVTMSRYPIRRGLDLLPPERFYGEGDAREALELASRVVELCERGISLASSGT